MLTKKGMKVLVVDDEKVVRDFLSRFLSLEAVEVKTAEDGFSAIEQAKKEKFDLVFLDVRMPKMDGLKTFLELKKINPETKYVMMTGYGVDELVEQAKKEGIFAYLKKPFDIEQMLSILKATQERHPERTLRIMVVDDDEMLLDLFKKLLKEKSCEAVTVKTGKEALEKIKQIEFDLVFLDLVLSDTSGMELCSQIHQIKPDLDIILITAHPEKVGKLQDKISGCLYKPFEIERIFQEIERIKNQKRL